MRHLWQTTFLAAACLAVVASCASGQTTYDPSAYPQYPQYVQYPDGTPPVTPNVPAGQVALNQDQIDQLLGPIALYPDPLLSLIFPAATYPQDVSAAEQWLQATPNPTEDAINAQPWDASIKGLVHYPTVLKMMSDQMDWTDALGAAFLNQQQDVMDSVQRLRAAAQAAQNLNNTQQEQVLADDTGSIRIEPINPDVIYVPQYDPLVVYSNPCPITFGIGFPLGFWCDNDFDWRRRCVVIGGGWFNGWHHPDDWDRRRGDWDHHPANWRPDPHPWTRTALRPAPRITPRVITKVGLDHPRVSPARKPDGAGARPPTTPTRIGNAPATTPPHNVFVPPTGGNGAVGRGRGTANNGVGNRGGADNRGPTVVKPTPSTPPSRGVVNVPQPVKPPVSPVVPRTVVPVTPARPTVTVPTRPPITVRPAPTRISPVAPRVVQPPVVRETPAVPRSIAPPQIHQAPQSVFRGSSSGGQTRVESGRGRASTHR